jgi:hypothetical protein
VTSGAIDLSFSSLLLMNAAIGTTMTGTAALAAASVSAGEHATPYMHDWLCALLAADGHGLVLLDRPSLDYRRHDRTVTGRPDPWWHRLGRETTRTPTAGRDRRTDLVRRAAANAKPLVDGGLVEPQNRRLVEMLVDMADRPAVTRRDLLALRRAGVRPRPLLRELAWYR